MYNIDFKISGQIVSIYINHNDTIATLTSRMKELAPFRKYSKTELENKLAMNFNQITKSTAIDKKIKLRIQQLLDSIRPKVASQRVT